MPDLNTPLVIDMTLGEFNELVASVNRSITSQQQMISRMVLQAQAQTSPAHTQTPAAVPAEAPAPRPNGSEPGRPRRSS
jgi:hypothetical protein